MKTMMKTAILGMLVFLNVEAAQAQEFTTNLNKTKSVVKQFLKQVNDPKTKVGRLIATTRARSVDGRNHDGIISKPVTTKDLQVVISSNEVLTNAWRYADIKNGYCAGDGDSLVYEIFLSTTQGINSATANDTMRFTVEVQEQIRVKILKPEYVDDCEKIIGPNEHEEFGDFESRVVIESITYKR